MFSYTSHLAQIKKYPITFLIVPFFLVATSFKPVFNTNNPKTLSIHRSTLKESSNNSTAFYVPRIGLVKEGVLNPGGAGIQPCTTIDYTYYITNQSTNGESLEAVVLDDPSAGIFNINLNNVIGDINTDNFLDIGEVWIYTISYNITSEERVAGEVRGEQATVNASSNIGNITDNSHPNDFLDDGDTITDISECQPRVSLVKTGDLDPAGFAPCTTIEYSFSVTNESLGPEEFQNIQLNDSFLASSSISGPTFDSGGDGKMSPGETWEFIAYYTITQNDIQQGEVQNQAEVYVEIDATGDIITDFSHPIDPLSDDFTVTDLISCQSPELAILLTGTTADSDNDNCDDVVVYTYQVTNKGNVDLEMVTVTDDLGTTPILQNPNLGDINGNGRLDTTEIWIYTSAHPITPENITNNPLDNQATATANIVGSGTPTSDQSHPTDESSARLTSVDVSGACDNFDAGISLILRDINLNCTGSLEYLYEVRRAGSVNLQNITLTDNLGNVIITIPTGDDNNNDVLEDGEIWTYTSTAYNITQDELNLGAVTNQATVTAVVENTLIPVIDDSHPSDPQDDDVTITDLTSCQSPELAVLLTGTTADSDSDNCDDVVVYTYQVTNKGNVDLDNLIATDILTNAIVLVTDPNNNGILDLGETQFYTSTYDITEDNITNMVLENQATATGNIVGSATPTSDQSHPTDESSAGLTSIDVSGACDTFNAGISLVLSVNNPGACTGSLEYQYEVTRAGSVNLGGIVLSDDLGNLIAGPNGDANSNDVLEAGETWTYTSTYNITQGELNLGAVTNQAMVNAVVQNTLIPVIDDSHPSDPLSDDVTRTDISSCQSPELAVLLTGITADSDNDNCDDVVTYTYQVTNKGNVDLDNVVVTDDLGNSPILENPNLGDLNGNGRLDIAEIWTYTSTYGITPENITNIILDNQATATANIVGSVTPTSDLSHPTDESSAGLTSVDVSSACADTASIAVVREVQMMDTDMDGCNDQIDFVIEVSNSGGLDLINIVLTDDQLGNLGNPFGDVGNDGILLQGAGEVWTYTGSYDITQGDIDGGDIFSRATVQAESSVGNFPVQDISHPTDPADDADNEILFSGACDDTVGISIIRSAALEDGDGDTCMDRLAITIEVTNTGNAPLENVVVNDDLLVNAPTLSSNGNGDTILDSGETWEYTGSYDLDQTDIGGINVISGADVTAQHIGSTFQVSDDSHPSAPNLDQDNDNDVSGACANTAAITLNRTHSLSDSDTDNCPDTIDFRIVVTNSGQVDLDTVVLTDDQLPSPVIGPDDESINTNGILEVGEEWTYTGSYNITPENIANTPLISAATVTAEPLGSTFQVSDNDQNNIDLSSACASFSAAVSVTLLDSLSDSNNDGCDDRIIYTYTVSNIGSADLGQIVLTDDLGNTITAPTPNPGDLDNDNEIDQMEDWVFTATYFITQTDIDNSPQHRLNQANVSVQPIGNTTNVTSDSNTTSTDVSSACLNDTASIGLIKTASLFDSDGDNCNDSVLYFFTVENLGNIALENILLEDFFLGITLTEPNSRNLNEDEILNVGEQWNYNLVRPIVQQDIDRAFIENQAMVTAYRTDLPDTFITDFSHQSTYTLDDLTSISVIGACINTSAGIGLVKTGVLIDLNEDGCLESIRYTFRIANLGNQPLTGLLLRDDLFENPIEGPLSGDDNDNDILEVDEEWTYTVVYGITQEDLNIGFVENQATITANVVGQENFIVNDISDSDLFTRDNLTRVSVIEACLGGTISDSDFKIFTGITPNGDGINDFFRIQGIERYPNNTLKIYNRWGVMVYEVEEYGEGSNLFNGISIGRATIAGDKELPSGTYFYILSFLAENPGEENYSGYLYINRN
nr:gliding motility-associated C-terminal domain-containing protein [uncultured Allomuricauda sp.]